MPTPALMCLDVLTAEPPEGVPLTHSFRWTFQLKWFEVKIEFPWFKKKKKTCRCFKIIIRWCALKSTAVPLSPPTYLPFWFLILRPDWFTELNWVWNAWIVSGCKGYCYTSLFTPIHPAWLRVSSELLSISVTWNVKIVTWLLKTIHRPCCEQFHFAPQVSWSGPARYHWAFWSLKKKFLLSFTNILCCLNHTHFQPPRSYFKTNETHCFIIATQPFWGLSKLQSIL